MNIAEAILNAEPDELYGFARALELELPKAELVCPIQRAGACQGWTEGRPSVVEIEHAVQRIAAAMARRSG